MCVCVCAVCCGRWIELVDLAVALTVLCPGTMEEKVECLFASIGSDGGVAAGASGSGSGAGSGQQLSRADMRHFLRQLVALLSGADRDLQDDLASWATAQCFAHAGRSPYDDYITREEFEAWYRKSGGNVMQRMVVDTAKAWVTVTDVATLTRLPLCDVTDVVATFEDAADANGYLTLSAFRAALQP